MFGNFARVVARPAVAAAAATAAANAAQGSAQARAPPQGTRQAPQPQAHSKIVDRDSEGWLLAELKDDVILFQPFDAKEVEEAAGTVMALWSGRPMASPHAGPIITEVGETDNDNGSITSGSGDERLADAVIEAAAAANSHAVAMGRIREQEQLKELMTITTRMLKRPGMQKEVVMAMLEDSEVRELMLGHCNDLDCYLTAAGINNPALLPAPETMTFSSEGGSTDNDGGAEPRSGGPPLVSRLVGTMAGALERAGEALASLGGWLRRRLQAMFPKNGEERIVEVGDLPAASGGARGQSMTAQVLSTVMILAVAIICVMFIRKPLVLRSLRRV